MRILSADELKVRAARFKSIGDVVGLDTDSRPLETAFRLRYALRLLADPVDPAVAGTIEEHLAGL